MGLDLGLHYYWTSSAWHMYVCVCVMEAPHPAYFHVLFVQATDWLDGYLARHMGLQSVLGSYLDPLGDKVSQ